MNHNLSLLNMPHAKVCFVIYAVSFVQSQNENCLNANLNSPILLGIFMGGDVYLGVKRKF